MAFFDPQNYTYDPYTGPYGSWYAKDGSGSYAGDAQDYQSYFGLSDPGVNVVNNYGNDAQSTTNYATTPFFGWSDYAGNIQSADPAAIADWKSKQNKGDLISAAEIAALVGGGALAGGFLNTGGAFNAAGTGVGDAGAAGGAGSGSAIGGGSGTVLTPLGGTAPISGTAIDAAGNAIGPSTLFGTSSIPFDGGIAAATGGLGSVSNAASGAGAGSGMATGPNGLPDSGVGQGLDSVSSGAGQVASSSLPSWLQSLLPYSGLIGAGLGLVDSALQPNSTTTTQGGTSNSTNSSTLQLPSQLTGAAGTALDRANQLLGQGQQFAPTPYLLNHAADQLNNLGSNTAPTTSSFASGANINPYLDMTFNAAADSTQNRLGTEFANAGQVNSPQHQGDRSQELQTLAAGIYGPGYTNAQNLQYGAQEAGVSRGLQQQDSNLNRTLQGAQTALPIAQYMQQQQQAQLNGPQTSLNSYISQLGGLSPYFPGTSTQTQATNQTGNVTQPLYNNPITSAVGGALTGNYFGNMIGGQQQGQSVSAVTPNAQMPAYTPGTGLGGMVSAFGSPSQYQTTPGSGPNLNMQSFGGFSPVYYDQTGMPQVNYGGNLSGINNLYTGIGGSINPAYAY